jgi:hypothetical protein
MVTDSIRNRTREEKMGNEENENRNRDSNTTFYSSLVQDNSFSFRQQGRLIHDAFLVSNLLRILTRIIREHGVPNIAEKTELTAGLELLKRLQKADHYVHWDDVNLLAKPEGVGVVTTMIREGWNREKNSIEFAANRIAALSQAQETPAGSQLDEYQMVNELLLRIHRSIMDQLDEAVENLDAL